MRGQFKEELITQKLNSNNEKKKLNNNQSLGKRKGEYENNNIKVKKHRI